MTALTAKHHRVALVTSSFAPHIGGVETHVARVARGLAERGHAVEVWTVDRGEGLGARSRDGITVRVLPTPLPARNAGALARFVLRSPGAWRRWVSAYREFQPTVLHVHCFGPNGVYALTLHRRFRVPLVVTSHGETFMDDHGAFDQSALLRRALTAALHRAALVTAPSQAVLDDLAARFALRSGVVIPNGVDLNIHPRPTPIEGRYFFAGGRLGRTKGFDLLLDAFASARFTSDVRLVIGGDGPERAALEKRATASDLAGRVTFAGWMDEQAICDAMGGSIAVVVPSRIEAFGIVALEAWRAGAPLIMTRHGGATEFMHDGMDAILVDPTAGDALVQALRHVGDDGDLRARLGSAGHGRVAQFSWKRVVAAYDLRFDQIARER